MSAKVSTYFPKYQLRRPGDNARSLGVFFRHEGIFFSTQFPSFGMTETQKVALRWASHNTPPVICVKHGAPVKPNRTEFRDKDELHRWYCPYAMVIATLDCLGEETPRQIRIYFCDVWLHEDNRYRQVHSKSRGVYIDTLP